MTKAIALLSGGLDSILATSIILEHGIDVEAVNFLTVFCNCTERGKSCLASKSAADTLGIKLKVFEVSKEYFEVIKNPKYGYGSNMNPCIDCRIFMFRKAGEYMRASGAQFIVTGEVLGERPMSQRIEAMKIIESESGLDGLIVRPLSAKLMKPTIPEEKGLVERDRLLSIKGRSRKPQMELAKKFGINDYPCPAGGCLLTYQGFAEKMRDLIRYKPDFTVNDARLLKVGRHFRLNPGAKLVVGKDKEQNDRLMHLAQEDDTYLYPVDVKGPVGIGRGKFYRDDIEVACAIVARYCDTPSDQRVNISYKQMPGETTELLQIMPAAEEVLNRLRI